MQDELTVPAKMGNIGRVERHINTTPWSPDEDSALQGMIAAGKAVEVVADIMKRSPLAIRKRASKLKIPLRIIYEKSRRASLGTKT